MVTGDVGEPRLAAISEVTYQVSERFNYEELEPVTVKAKLLALGGPLIRHRLAPPRLNPLQSVLPHRRGTSLGSSIRASERSPQRQRSTSGVWLLPVKLRPRVRAAARDAVTSSGDGMRFCAICTGYCRRAYATWVRDNLRTADAGWLARTPIAEIARAGRRVLRVKEWVEGCCT